MRKKCTLLLLSLFVSGLCLNAQNDADWMDEIRISQENNQVLVDIKTSLKDIIQQHQVLIQTDLSQSTWRDNAKKDNSRANAQKNQDSRPSKDTILIRSCIWLSIIEEGDFYKVLHSRTDVDKPYDTSVGEEIIKKKYLLANRDMRRLVAYELYKRYYDPNIDAENEYLSLKSIEADLIAKHDGEQRKYTALSFLPPVNQFCAHTSKGTANGIAILAGYGVSVSTFIWSTTSYSANKRRLDNVSSDLAEADKAREYYNGQMDICRGGQIASGILFIGTYIYGVANALANRDAYQKKTEVSLAPVAYDNGAGIALVYRF